MKPRKWKKHVVVVTGVHSEHDTLAAANAAVAKIKLKKDQWAVVITPKKENSSERRK